MDKIGTVTDLPLDKNTGVDFKEINTGEGISVRLDNVNHRFADSQVPTLKNINMDIKAGEKVCIVGYNGSGKTTLIQVISCFLNDYQGAVLYNNIPRKNFNQKSLRYFIGDYSSKEDIFKGTLRENIDLSNPNIHFSELVNVTNAVGLTGFISTLPNGFDTMLLPEGKNLPRNVVAKIILARSIVTTPQLLAIEEIMANIELKDRTGIAHLLTDKNKPWTLVAVTNDPVLASRCDRVFVMKDGEIVEEGSFEKIKHSEHFNKILK